MKLSNLFKKETKKIVKSNVQTLDKNQLEKVIGGLEEVLPETTERSVHTATLGPAKGK